MGDKIRVLCLSIIYPLAMSSYFKRALQRREDVEFVDCGPYTGSWIAWKGGCNVLEKYAIPPVIPLPFPPNVGRVSYDLVRAMLDNNGYQGWKPDIVLNVDAGICWHYKPTEGMAVHVATDPHCLNYDHQRSYSDKFFNMQMVYAKPNDLYLPYAFDPTVHFPTETVKDVDASLIGMAYQQRIQWVEGLKRHGVNVIFENGPIFDEYRELANRSRIGLNWSSLDDTNARAFEIPAFKLAPVMNRTTDMAQFFSEDVDYAAFNHGGPVQDAIEKTLYLVNHPQEAQEMAERAYVKVLPHTYDQRVRTILETCGFGG